MKLNGTTYPTGVPEAAARVLETCRTEEVRVRLVYSEGEGYEPYNRDGYVGRSTGNPNRADGGVKAALLFHNHSSMGGGLIDAGFLRILTTKGKRVLWEAGQ